MSDTNDQVAVQEPGDEQIRPLVSKATDGEVIPRETSAHKQDFLASRGFKMFVTVLVSVLLLVLCGSILLFTLASLTTNRPPTEVLATLLLTIFGVLITGIFVFMTLRIDSGAIREAQAVAQAEARRQAEFVAEFVAPKEARQVAERVALTEGARAAREESSKVAREVSREAAKAEAGRVARKTASDVADDVARDVARSVAREAASDAAREVARSEFDRIFRIISEYRSR